MSFDPERMQALAQKHGVPIVRVGPGPGIPESPTDMFTEEELADPNVQSLAFSIMQQREATLRGHPNPNIPPLPDLIKMQGMMKSKAYRDEVAAKYQRKLDGEPMLYGPDAAARQDNARAHKGAQAADMKNEELKKMLGKPLPTVHRDPSLMADPLKLTQRRIATSVASCLLEEKVMNGPGFGVDFHLERQVQELDILATLRPAVFGSIPSDPHGYKFTDAHRLTCANCQKTSGADETLLKCSACRTVAYCNAKCQKNHWKTHKICCGSIDKRTERVQQALQTLSWGKGVGRKTGRQLETAAVRKALKMCRGDPLVAKGWIEIVVLGVMQHLTSAKVEQAVRQIFVDQGLKELRSLEKALGVQAGHDAARARADAKRAKVDETYQGKVKDACGSLAQKLKELADAGVFEGRVRWSPEHATLSDLIDFLVRRDVEGVLPPAKGEAYQHWKQDPLSLRFLVLAKHLLNFPSSEVAEAHQATFRQAAGGVKRILKTITACKELRADHSQFDRSLECHTDEVRAFGLCVPGAWLPLLYRVEESG